MTGRPSIWLDVGGTRRRAVYSGPIGESTDALEFSYTVQAGDRDGDGVALCASGPGCGSIALNGGSIRGVAGRVDAKLALPEMGPQADHKVEGLNTVYSTDCPPEIAVPSDWALKPSGIAVGGKFRLLFVSSIKRNAVSTNIADYNAFVQARAAAGHSAIRDHNAGFRVLGSTQAVNARVNTCTQSTDRNAALYWLNGVKVANDYAGLYDGSWDSGAGRLENGNGSSATRVWTGTNNNGTTTGGFLGRRGGPGGRDVTFGRSNETSKPLKDAECC